MSEITLYDLPKRGDCACWSLNPWKARILLNYKNVPYKTEWIEYPAIASKFKSFGLEPNTEGMAYTVPVVHVPNHEPAYIMESKAIAATIDELHPTPPIHLDAPILGKVEATLPKIMMGMGPIMLPRVPRNILNDASVAYFEETRAQRFGMPLAQLESEKGGEPGWAVAMPGLTEMASLLKETPGPFFMGEEVSYADFVLAGFFQFARCAGEDIFERMMKVDAAFPKLYKGTEPWLARDSH